MLALAVPADDNVVDAGLLVVEHNLHTNTTQHTHASEINQEVSWIGEKERSVLHSGHGHQLLKV